jgi:hypothetical protein
VVGAASSTSGRKISLAVSRSSGRFRLSIAATGAAADCDSLERAMEIARRWPDVRFGGAIEVRALMHEGGAEM